MEFAQALNTAIAQLTAEIAFLHSELIRIQRETDAAIQLRKEEHETFQKAKTDHDEVLLEKRIQFSKYEN